MLPRRVAEHVKAQNWTALGLDFLIVVVGVLVAFWVNAWADDRASQSRVAVSLEALRMELEANIQSTYEYEERHTGVITAGQQLLDLGREADLEGIPGDLLGKVFLSAWTTDHSTGALTSLINTQGLDFIEDQDLRLAIAALPRRYEDAFEDEYLVIDLIDSQWFPYISQHVSIARLSEFQTNDTPAAHASELVYPADASQWLNSLAFQNHVHYRMLYQRLVLSEIEILRLELQNTLALIDRELQ